MKLRMLREHYHSKDDQIWVPKKAFKTREEIREQLGFDPDTCHIYECSFCNLLHTSDKNRNRIK